MAAIEQLRKQSGEERIVVRFSAAEVKGLKKSVKATGETKAGFVRAASIFAAEETAAGRAAIINGKLVAKTA